MKIKVSEIFYSLQGEGLYLGTPSIFIRTFGCNFKCQGFGMPPGELSNEYLKVDPAQYKKYEDLPLVHTGCDSYPAWDVRFKHLSPTLTIEQIAERVSELLPNGKFTSEIDLILTGGEPLLGWQRAYPALLEELRTNLGLGSITFETNGTQKIQEPFLEYLNSDKANFFLSFSVSSKLPSSGEKWEEAIQPLIVRDYYEKVSASMGWFKWVCSSPEDLEAVQKAEKAYKAAGINWPIYLMPAGGTEQGYHKNKQWLSKVCMAHGYRYSPRLQIDLFGNQWAT